MGREAWVGVSPKPLRIAHTVIPVNVKEGKDKILAFFFSCPVYCCRVVANAFNKKTRPHSLRPSSVVHLTGSGAGISPTTIGFRLDLGLERCFELP